MGTERLSDYDKSNISETIGRILVRALYNKKFPIKEKKFFDWMLQQMPKTHRKAYCLLRKENKKLITCATVWGAAFTIKSVEVEYCVSPQIMIPYEDMAVKDSDPHHAEVMDWLQWYEELYSNVKNAKDHIENLVWCCTSVGQIKRLLPAESLHLVPSHLLDFSAVERRSRVPASFTPDPEKMENLMQMLALGAISPEKRKGVHITITEKTILQ